jgi:hypothetical protein
MSPGLAASLASSSETEMWVTLLLLPGLFFVRLEYFVERLFSQTVLQNYVRFTLLSPAMVKEQFFS